MENNDILIQTVSVMQKCQEHGLYDDVVCVGKWYLDISRNDAYQCGGDKGEPPTQKTLEAFGELMAMMAYCQWRCAETKEEYHQLLHDVEHACYYGDIPFNDTGVVIGFLLREKAGALRKLSEYELFEQETRDMCLAQSIECIDHCVPMFNKLYDFNQNSDVHADLLWKRVEIHAQSDLAFARKLVLEALGKFKSTNEIEKILSLYNEITRRLFETEYNPVWVQAIQAADISSKGLYNELYNLLLKNYSSQEESPLANTFLHAICPEDRKTILIVDDILDAADVDFTKVQQVFTKDMIPHDIRFEGGFPPIPGMVYVPKTINSSVYVPSYQYWRRE